MGELSDDPAMIDARAMVRPSERATHRRLADGSGSVLLHLDSAAYHGLNEMGAEIWALIEQGIAFGDLVTRIRDQVEDAPPALDEEISAFLRDLEARDLVRIEPPTA